MNVTEVPDKGADARRIQTLDSLNDSQIAAIRKIPPYGVEPPPVMTVRYPVSRFTDRAFFDKEQARVFRRIAVPILPSPR